MSKLLNLLNIYQKNKEGDSYKDVIMELLNGDSLLYIPSPQDSAETKEADNKKQSKTLTFNSVFNIDGVNVLGVFSSEQALFTWATQPVPYKMLHSKDVIQLCEETTIGRIVIDSGLPTMFALNKNVE